MIVNVFFHIFPHITVWGSCFSLGSRRSPPASASFRLAFSSHTTHLTPLITTHLTPLITQHSSHTSHHHSSHTPHLIPLITHHSSHTSHHLSSHTPHLTALISNHSSHTSHTPRISHPSHSTHLKPLISHTRHLTPLISQHSSQTTHLTHLSTTHLTPLIRRLGRGCLSCGRRSTQSLLKELRSARPPLGPRPFVWQAQYTEPSAKAAARVAAACMGHTFLSCGRRSTQNLHEPSGGAAARVAAAWAAAAFRGRRPVHRAHPAGAAARVAAAWAAAFRVAGAVHRAFCKSCGTRGRSLGHGCRLCGRRSTQSCAARGRRLRRSCLSCGRPASRLGRGLSCGRRSTQSLLEELRRAWPPLGPRLAFTYYIFQGSSERFRTVSDYICKQPTDGHDLWQMTYLNCILPASAIAPVARSGCPVVRLTVARSPGPVARVAG